MSKKSNLQQKTASPEQIYVVGKNGIKVYPINYNGNWFIQVDNNGKITRFDKSILQKDINDAVASTIIFYFKKLTEK